MFNHCPTVGDLICWATRCVQCNQPSQPVCPCRCQQQNQNTCAGANCCCRNNRSSHNQANGCLNGACGIN